MGRPPGSTNKPKVETEKTEPKAPEPVVTPPEAPKSEVPPIEPEKKVEPAVGPKTVKPTVEKPLKVQAEPEKPAVVNSESDAMKLFKADYALPEGQNEVHVTSDGNVFYQPHIGEARTHAKQHKLKLYTLKF